MPTNNKRVGGMITFKVDGEKYLAKGNFTYNKGYPKREPVMGSDGYHGHKEIPQIAFIEGAITDRFETDTEKILKSSSVSVFLELANGKAVTGDDFYYAGEGTGSTEEGEFGIRYEGERLEVIT